MKKEIYTTEQILRLEFIDISSVDSQGEINNFVDEYMDSEGHRIKWVQVHVFKEKIKAVLVGSILSMAKYKEGEIKEALQEYQDIIFKELALE